MRDYIRVLPHPRYLPPGTRVKILWLTSSFPDLRGEIVEDAPDGTCIVRPDIAIIYQGEKIKIMAISYNDLEPEIIEIELPDGDPGETL